MHASLDAATAINAWCYDAMMMVMLINHVPWRSALGNFQQICPFPPNSPKFPLPPSVGCQNVGSFDF
jgi:hypothetical protein